MESDNSANIQSRIELIDEIGYILLKQKLKSLQPNDIPNYRYSVEEVKNKPNQDI